MCGRTRSWFNTRFETISLPLELGSPQRLELRLSYLEKQKEGRDKPHAAPVSRPLTVPEFYDLKAQRAALNASAVKTDRTPIKPSKGNMLAVFGSCSEVAAGVAAVAGAGSCG